MKSRLKEMTTASNPFDQPTATKTRIFAACQITSEIRMHLNSSIDWKHAALSCHTSFLEVRHQTKDYFGFYLDHPIIEIKSLIEIQNKIRGQLKQYCPKLDTNSFEICIFPQVFVF